MGGGARPYAANPILIVLHGGPGSPETVFFRASNAALEDAYTVVYWDQRGAGRYCAKTTLPPESMTIERFIADLDELTDQLRARFAKAKVALLGHSWGSALGVLYAARHPGEGQRLCGRGPGGRHGGQRGGVLCLRPGESA